MRKHSRVVLTLAKYAISILLLWLLVEQVDIDASWAAAKDVSPAMLVVALLLEVMQVAIVSLRWKYVVHSIGSRLPFPSAIVLLSIGMFLGQVLPGAVGGDVVRIWKTRQAGLSISASINSVLLERIATVLGLLMFLAVSVPLFLGKYYKLSFDAWLFPVLMLAAICGIASLMFLDRITVFFQKWLISHHLNSLARDTRLMFLHPAKVLWLMLLVIAGHLNLCFQVWVLAIGLGLSLTVSDSLLLVPPVILLAYLPITLGGWGIREVAMVTALGLVGISNSQSLVLSVLFGLVGLVVSLPGLVFWMQAKHMTSHEARAPG